MADETQFFDLIFSVHEFPDILSFPIPQTRLSTPICTIDQPKENEILGRRLEGTSQLNSFTDPRDLSILQVPESPLDTILPDKLIGREIFDYTEEELGLSRPKTYENFSQTESAPNAIHSYLKLVPLINTVNSTNCGELLVSTLRYCPIQVPLDDFYNLVMNNYIPNYYSSNQTEVPNFGAPRFENQGLLLIFYILETLRAPLVPVDKFAVGLVNNPDLLGINFDHVRKVFLAVKIIMDCSIEVKYPSNVSDSISRKALVHAYFFLCEKLLKLSPIKPKLQLNFRNLKLGSSYFGRIMRTVYPNLKVKRFGKRGNSQYHYFGVKWNSAVFALIDFSPLQNQTIMTPQKEFNCIHHITSSQKTEAQPGSRENYQKSPTINKFSFFGCINPLSKYPRDNCLPRVWEFHTGRVPNQSKWARNIIHQSVLVLRSMKVEVEWLNEDFHSLLFTSEFHDNICTAFEKAFSQFRFQSSSESAHFHLYLVFLLSTFPACLASNDEVSIEDKYKLGQNLKALIASLRTKCTFRTGNGKYFLNFTILIEKMIHLNKLISARVKTNMVDEITQLSGLNLTLPAITRIESLGITTEMDEVIFTSVLSTIQAMKSEVWASSFEGITIGSNQIPTEIAKELARCFKFITNSILQIPEMMTGEDLSQENFGLPFGIFKIQLSAIHHLWLSQPLTSQLPIVLISNIISAINRELQNITFRDFGRWEKKLASETFKLWWVCLAAVEEYLSILSEIVALSDFLSHIQAKKPEAS